MDVALKSLSARAKLFTHSSACVALVEHGFQVCLMSNLFCMTTYWTRI